MTTIPENLPSAKIDPTRLGQALGNLLHNAIRYTPEGEHVLVEANQEGDMLCIAVSDGGPGITTDEAEKIFQPFYRGDQGRKIKQGMGLGLSIARDLVEAHDGRLELKSAPNQGSRFTIWLPI